MATSSSSRSCLHQSRIGYCATEIGLLVSVLSLAMGAVELEVGRIAAALGRRWTLISGGNSVRALARRARRTD